ncbi:hypothetical protein CF326_g5912 [Tilletia indica]|nr:hypothetical protein CF326_g5912 [Tilletia indica]
MLHRDYWLFYQGTDATTVPNLRDAMNALTFQRLPVLRCISLDLRPHEPITKSSLRLWKTVHAPRWVRTSSILTRLLVSARGLQELNLRISAQQDLIDLVQDIIANNVNLRIIRVDVDSAVVNGRNIRPQIHIRKMFPAYRPRACLDRFLLRAPSCDIHIDPPQDPASLHFLRLLQGVKEFVLACSILDANMTTLMWLIKALQSMPTVELFDLAVNAKDHHATPTADMNFPSIRLPVLSKLSLQLPELDGHLLRALNAPELNTLRLLSGVPLQAWPHCEINHFPNLFVANISCVGPSAVRMRALGLRRHQFAHSLTRFDNWTNSHSLPFLVLIKPHTSQRVLVHFGPQSSASETMEAEAGLDIDESSSTTPTTLPSHSTAPLVNSPSVVPLTFPLIMGTPVQPQSSAPDDVPTTTTSTQEVDASNFVDSSAGAAPSTSTITTEVGTSNSAAANAQPADNSPTATAGPTPKRMRRS